jgi:hypothetical protein
MTAPVVEVAAAGVAAAGAAVVVTSAAGAAGSFWASARVQALSPTRVTMASFAFICSICLFSPLSFYVCFGTATQLLVDF